MICVCDLNVTHIPCDFLCKIRKSLDGFKWKMEKFMDRGILFSSQDNNRF